MLSKEYYTTNIYKIINIFRDRECLPVYLLENSFITYYYYYYNIGSRHRSK